MLPDVAHSPIIAYTDDVRSFEAALLANGLQSPRARMGPNLPDICRARRRVVADGDWIWPFLYYLRRRS